MKYSRFALQWESKYAMTLIWSWKAEMWEWRQFENHTQRSMKKKENIIWSETFRFGPCDCYKEMEKPGVCRHDCSVKKKKSRSNKINHEKVHPYHHYWKEYQVLVLSGRCASYQGLMKSTYRHWWGASPNVTDDIQYSTVLKHFSRSHNGAAAADDDQGVTESVE